LFVFGCQCQKPLDRDLVVDLFGEAAASVDLLNQSCGFVNLIRHSRHGAVVYNDLFFCQFGRRLYVHFCT
jgi:hypothetical protein